MELSLTSKLKKKLKKKSDIFESDIRREMQTYESLPDAKKEEDTLDWWKNHSEVIPILSKLARRFLAIPASSSKSERVFSSGTNFVTAKRSNLNPEKVEDLKCAKI